MIESLLDFGCMELVFPMVNSPEQARRFAKACYYPPLGDRSQATCRGDLLHGINYGAMFQKNFMLRVMIEHRDAVNRLEEILDVPGVGGCLIGPTDLGASMRAAGDTSDVEQIYSRAVSIGRRLGKSMGIAVPDMTQAMDRINQGFDTVIVFSDRKVLLEGVSKLTGTCR
jgi:4-hydroxy-2-oxoheptanedioate aldolase